jgi:hypothetical protein
MQGLFDSLNEPDCDAAMQAIGRCVEKDMPWVAPIISEGESLDEELIRKIVAAGRKALQQEKQGNAAVT